MAFSPDGKTIVSGSVDMMSIGRPRVPQSASLKVWDVGESTLPTIKVRDAAESTLPRAPHPPTMLTPIENDSPGRRRECKITDSEDPLYWLTAITVLIPKEVATVCASEEKFRADHREVEEWDEYSLAHSKWLEEVEKLQEERQPLPCSNIEDDDDYSPVEPQRPSCTKPSAEFKKMFDERIAQYKCDMEFLGECRKRAHEKLVAQVHPDLYVEGELGGVAHNAFGGYFGMRKRGRSASVTE